MDTGQVIAFTATWANLLPEGTIVGVQERLKKVSEDKMGMLSTLQLKNPITGLICGLVAGYFGVDRFYKGDIGLGIVKLLTLGGFTIWAIIDLFVVHKGIKMDNLNKVNTMLIQLGV